ncbi:MAG: hypothetical protein L0228_10780 [Planctomycetes bacterium]|nr:hypothetical protein [Planctomycetota bacterium]
MADTEKQNGRNVWWLSPLLLVLEKFGFPTVACIAFAVFAYRTIEWERQQMVPALQEAAKSIDRNTDALDSVSVVLSELQQQLPHDARNAHSRKDP